MLKLGGPVVVNDLSPHRAYTEWKMAVLLDFHYVETQVLLPLLKNDMLIDNADVHFFAACISDKAAHVIYQHPAIALVPFFMQDCKLLQSELPSSQLLHTDKSYLTIVSEKHKAPQTIAHQSPQLFLSEECWMWRAVALVQSELLGDGLE